MKHEDGFVIFNQGYGGQPSLPPLEAVISDDLSATGFRLSYQVARTLSEAKGYLSHALGLETEDPENPSGICRARVYDDGRLSVYRLKEADGGVQGEEPDIGPDDRPFLSYSHVDLCRIFGVTPAVGPSTFGAGDHLCLVDIKIHDVGEFYDYLGNDPAHARPKDLTDGLFARFANEEFGADLMSISSAVDDDGMMKVLLKVQVYEPDLFRTIASVAGRNAGRDHDWTPENAQEAIFECWCGANDSPSPDEIGIEIYEWREPTPEEVAELSGEATSPSP